MGSRSSYHILYCVCVICCLDWRTVLGQTGLLEGEGGVVRCSLIPLWERRKCNEGCEQLTRTREQDCCFFPNWNCLCRYFRYSLPREKKKKREDLLCSQCLRNKLVIFLKLAWGLLHKADSCCSQNMCFLASKRNNIKNKMSEKESLQWPSQRRDLLRALESYMWHRKMNMALWFQNLSGKCVSSFKRILLKQIKWKIKAWNTAVILLIHQAT